MEERRKGRMAQQTEFNIIGNLKLRVDDAESDIKKLQSSISKLKIPADFGAKFTKSFSNLEGIFSRFKTQLDAGFNSKADVSNITKITKEMDTELGKLSHLFKEITGKTIDFKVDSSKIVEAQNRLKEFIEQKNRLAKEALKITVETDGKSANIENVLQGIQNKAGKTKAGQYAKEALDAYKTGNITAYIEAVEKLEKAFKRLKDEAKITADVANGITMGEGVKAIARDAENAKNKTKELDKSIEGVKNDISGLQADQLSRARIEVEKLASDSSKLELGMRQVGLAAKEMANSSYNMSKQLGDLQQSTQYFFSLRNMINLLKQGIDQAVESVKNLDKAMTETAVVTNFSVADMWKDLPKYTKLANELGATTQGAYETMTLYYQQGLDQQATFEIGAETMKMARIAGLDYAQTTDMMTAALRGFNMELNETSAQRINDVYSNLAAKTASNTKEIGEAMERTASIAHSAGMSFEGTAAFLAQMIETTREAPENLGTAMKTIVARFQELKKNPLEISEVDGEEVDFNRVDTALKTIGVDLVATNGQFRNLDEVFLDISKKWGSLTQMQQRYIATIAAGSRQQSRFIAMVGSYDRTMELMDYANESAGASQEQFNKTLDSFEAKMNRLQNAWQQFTMGIANNTFVKGTVDGITLIIDKVNELIDGLSHGNGVIKSFLSIFTAFTGLKIAGRAMNGLIGGLGGMLDPTTKGGFGKGMQTGAMGMGANRITVPIVSKLGDILNAINGIKNKGIKTEKTNTGNYEKSRNDLKALNKGGNVELSKVRKAFKGLSPEDQARLFQRNRGTMNAIQRSAFKMMDSAFTDNPKMQMLGKTIQADIFKGMAKGQIKPEVGLRALGNPSSWGAIAGTDAAKGFSANYSQKMEEAASKARQWMGQNYYKSIEQIQKEDPETRKKSAEAYKKAYQRRLAEEKGNLGLGYKEDQAPLSKMDKLANATSGVGDAFIGAGQSISSFGMLLSQLGGPVGAVGSALQSFGGIVTNVGMAIGGIGSAFSGLQSVAAALGTTVGAMALPIAAIVGAFAALGYGFYRAQKRNEEIKKDAKDVADAYDKATKRIEKNRTTLKNYQGEWERLSRGVDSNGMNVSLEQADYDKYQEMVQKIADVNPEIIEGFNSQGKAIITNNQALSETLRLLDQQEKKARKEYTSDESFRKVIAARDINKGYYKQLRTQKEATSGYWLGGGNKFGTTTEKANTPMQSSVQALAKSLQDADFNVDVDKVLSRYDTSLKQIENGEKSAIRNFVKNQDSINSELQVAASEAGETATDYYTDSLEKSFTSLSKDTAKFNKAIQPTIDLLAAKLTDSQAYKDIAPEMRSALMTGLEDIAAEDKSYKDIISDAESFATELGAITAEDTEYAKAMQIAADAQENFADTLNVGKYTKDSEEAITKLQNLIEQYENSNESYAQALTEHLKNQVSQIQNFTEEGSISLTEALNEMTYKIQAAESALENFQETTKTDYSTAAQGMKSIYDEIFKETELEDGTKAKLHTQGKGDRTFETGAISLLGRETVADIYKNNKDGFKAEDEIEKRLKKLEPMLKEGAEGAQNFWNTLMNNKEANKIPGVLIDAKKGVFNIDQQAHPEAFHKLAVELGMSDDLLSSMINKLRQFGNIDLGNIKSVRKALSTDETVVHGQSGEQKKLYVSRAHLENAMTEAGYSLSEQAAEMKKIQKEGNVVIIDEPVELSKSSLKDMGITDLESAINVLGETGQYTKEQIFDVANKKFGATEEDFNESYKDFVDFSQDPALPSVQAIESTVQDIRQLLASNLVQNGKFDSSMSQASNYKQQVLGGEGADTVAQKFSLGKNANGKKLTDEEYSRSLAELNKLYKEGTTWVQQLETGLKAAQEAGDTEAAERIQKEIDAFNNKDNGYLKYLKDYIEAGKQKHQEEETKAKNEKTKTKEAGKQEETARGGSGGEKEIKPETVEDIKKSVTDLYNTASGKKAIDAYQKNGFMNTDLANRQVLNWGKDPTKNKNFKVAQAWGYTADKLKNAHSTFMSVAQGYGEDKNEIQIAFSPILQTKHGPEMLSPEAVNSYLDEIVGQATNKNGQINVSKLQQLDQQGINGISNLIMGAFSGKDAKDVSEDLGALEHYLSVLQENDVSIEEFLNTLSQQPPEQVETPNTPPSGRGGSTSDTSSNSNYVRGTDGNYHLVPEGPDLTEAPGQLKESASQLWSSIKNWIGQSFSEESSKEDPALETEVRKDTSDLIDQSTQVQEPETNAFNKPIAEVMSSAWDKIKEAYLKASAESNFEKPDYSKDIEKEVGKVGELPADSLISKIGNFFKKLKEGSEAEANKNLIPHQQAPGMPSNVPPNQQPKQPQQPQQPQQPKTTAAKVTVDTAEAETKLEQVKTKATETKATIDQGARFSISVPGLAQLSTVTKNVKALQSNSGVKKVGVSTTFNKDEVDRGVGVINRTTAKITVDAITGPAQAKIERLINGNKGRTIPLTVTLNQTGSKTVHINVSKSGNTVGGWNEGLAKGKNNKINATPVPTFASAAKGKGRLGPNGKGGLTLTGEKGYEIAWIPSENRSMILGASGPQMLDLPPDAVVWTHEQSKKILKQKSIPAGSNVGGSGMRFDDSGSTSSGTTSAADKAAKQVSNDSNTTKKNIDKATQKIESDVENTTKTVKRVSVYWDNMARKLEGAQRIMERSATNFEKYIKEMRATLKKTGQPLSSGGGGGDKYIDDITHVLGISKKMNAQAKKELRKMDKKRYKKPKDIKKAYENGSVSAMEISYEGYKKNKKGKKEKVTKTAYVNTAGYIKYDKNNRTYVIDQKALNKIGNKSKRQAVADELNKRLDERIKQRNSAQDGVDKAKEALDKMSEELYNTFFAWESELTVIWELTQQISNVTSKISRNKSYGDLLEAQFDTGYLNIEQYAEQMVSNFIVGVKKQTEKIKLDNSLIKATQKNITNLINQTEDKKNLADVRKKLKADTDATEKIANARKAKNKADKKVEKAQRNLLRVSATGRSPQEIKKAQQDFINAKKQQKIAKANLKKAKAGKLNDTERMGYEEYRDNLKKRIAAQQDAWKYLNVTRNSDGTLNIDFKQEKLREDKNKGIITEEKFKTIQDYVKELSEESENLNKAIDDLNTDLTEQYTTLKELQDDWYNYAEELWDISEEEQKNEIEQFKKLSDSIKDSMNRLLEQIKNKLDERRRKEDNANTERDISQKMQRLALLRADTSGGHAVEIAQLEKEIADAQQNYERSLEDQLIDQLQKQADLAAEQRERVIELEEALLESTNNAAQVNTWMANPKAYENEIREGWLRKNYPDYDKMPSPLQDKVDAEWNKFFSGLTTNQDLQEAQIEEIKATKDKLEAAKALSEKIKNSVEKIEQNTTPKETSKKEEKKTKEEPKKSAGSAPGSKSSAGAGASGKPSAKDLPKLKKRTELAMSMGVSGYSFLKKYANLKDVTWADILNQFSSAAEVRAIVGKAKVSEAFKKAFKTKFKKEFAAGGIADFTGPAWLDGTPSKPELVLNAADTKNFLALKDVLSRAVKAAGSLDESSSGDATYEININVDHISNDYDVDKIAKRVGKIITTNSSYRNVTQVRNLR